MCFGAVNNYLLTCNTMNLTKYKCGEKKERNLEIFNLMLNGKLSIKEIAKKFNISRTRVEQITRSFAKK